MLLFINLKVMTANRRVEKRTSFGIMLLEFSSYRDLIVLELFVNRAENDLRQLFSVRRPLLGLLSL